MNIWVISKKNETLLSEKGYFYSHLDIADLTDADCTHTERVFKDLEIKDLGEYHAL